MAGLRILTWNVHGCTGRDRRHDAERIAARIRHLAPDLAALQEIDTRRRPGWAPPNGGEDLVSYLSRQVGDHAHPAWALSGEDGEYGQILASRFPLEEPEIRDISVPGREPRKVITARIGAFARPLRVITTHLGLHPGERRRQIAALRTIVAVEREVATVLLGDLNEWRPIAPSRRGLFQDFEGVTAHASFPARFPVFALDRILWRQGVRLERSWVDRGARGASDHLPVVADFTIAE